MLPGTPQGPRLMSRVVAEGAPCAGLSPARCAVAPNTARWAGSGARQRSLGEMGSAYGPVQVNLPNEPQAPLENPVRLEILRAVCQIPGITCSQIMAAVGATRGTVNHHLKILRPIGYIEEHRVRKISSYAVIGTGERLPVQALTLLRHPVRRGLMAVLRKLGPSTASAIQQNWAALVGGVACPRSAKISLHAGLLLRNGLLSRHACGRSVRWGITLDVEKLARQRIEGFALGNGGVVRPYPNARPHEH